ncbi:hypothetical protein CI109_104153 [Kwoniella shandongensis]|uniref:Uncharacterized protein n=1 Tax=Kwoniella shandongensis TaxID=1734106 RepID=A0A5M6C0V9_9TREE|nr:uncharacterized protein CI109_002934 [Kwoniella shandongensis]KAA5528776.1 hypothetical protein CI109_002934 [Kwoniella shandongensis]
MSEVHGNLSHAMRDNYNEHGVDEYYRKVAASYRNPFFPGIKKVVWTFMNRWWEAEGRKMYSVEGDTRKKKLKILDMAAGSGEATLCLLEWAEKGKGTNAGLSSPISTSAGPSTSSNTDPLAALRSQIQPGQIGRPAFIPPNARKGNTVGVGKGKGKLVFGGMEPPKLTAELELDIAATDPYTSPAYTARTSRPCHPLSFTDLASGDVPPATTADDSGPIWDIIICSFALHLVTSTSELWALLYELSTKSRWLVIVAPHKKPEIKETWGWSRWDIASWSAAGEAKLYGGGKGDDEEEETELEIVRDKVKLRLYRSNAF